MQQESYPATLTVDYPDRNLDRLSTAFRILIAIPILIVLGTLTGGSWGPGGWDQGPGNGWGGGGGLWFAGGAGLLFIGPLLMILFRQKYPRWWFDWNLQLTRFGTRVAAYLSLMDDQYPSTDEEQAVHVDFAYPDVPNELNRWLPLVKWLLAIPHYIVLFFLGIAVFFAVVIAWFAILFTGRYPRSLFDFAEGVLRWSLRVTAYAFILVTDRYPPFSLRP
jgi:hypothetical protein